jgi:hypothetical protein
MATSSLGNAMIRILSSLKTALVPSGRHPRTIRGGLFKGIRMELDLRYQTQLYLGFFERELYPWIQKLSMGVRTAIDIGAGEGEYTLYFLTQTSAQVLAFEPCEDSRRRCLTNVALNVHDVDRSERFMLSSKYVGSVNGDESLTLDSLLPLIRMPCLIKIDVDGGEVDILHGAENLLRFPDVRWIIETHSKELEEGCVELFTRAGFVTRIVPNAWWRVIVPELRPSVHNRWLVAFRGREGNT